LMDSQQNIDQVGQKITLMAHGTAVDDLISNGP